MEKTVIVKFKGGMGNQMFQYAFARALEHAAQKSGTPVRVLFDTTGYVSPTGGETFRKLLITHLNTNISIATTEQCMRARNPLGFFSRILRGMRNLLFPNYNIQYSEKHLSPPFHDYYEGYWQTPLYFSEIESTIRNDFTFKTPLGAAATAMLAQIENDPNAVSIFYRRTDYVGHSDLDIGEQAYQERAIAKMLEYVPHAHFYVMSDDIEWVKKNAHLPEGSIFVSSPAIKDYEEVRLASACKHNIIPNSTFAWWGAWLNGNKDKYVIMPKIWSTKYNDTSYRHIAPKGWTRV